MLEPPIPPDEEERLALLRRLEILDTPPEERFDRLTSAAAHAFGVPIALVSLIDANRQWFKSRQGLDVPETSRAVSFCGHAIAQDGTFVVPDACSDQRFRDNPLVTGDPGIRFYAGRPLTSLDGTKLGTLCLIDTKARALTDSEDRALRHLASQVEDELSAHRVKLGPYQLEEVIGRGGMGVVYKARDAKLSRRAAVKVILREHARDETFLKRFHREAQALAAVSHPNVVTVFAVDEERGVHYLALEYLEGGSLASRVAKAGPLPWAGAARLGAQLADALAALHAVGLVHRDLKPANVLFDARGRPKLADFGLARSSFAVRERAAAELLEEVVLDRDAARAAETVLRADRPTRVDDPTELTPPPTSVPAIEALLTEAGRIVGTPAFMAPEQAFGGTVDGRADLYALGATLYAVLAGRPPFTSSGSQLLRDLARETPWSLTPLGVPPALDALVLRLLAKDPDARGPAALELAAELSALAGPPSAPTPRP